MVPHVIRLHRVWQSTLVAPAHPVASAPSFTRAFGRPSGLESVDRVWLVLDPVFLEAAVACNRQVLRLLGQAGAPLEFDITDLLAERNELLLAADWLPTLPEVGRAVSFAEGLVKLEIRGEAWIEGLCLTVEDEALPAQLELGGRVATKGAASSLAIGAAALKREVLYREVGAGDFRLVTTAPEVPRWMLGERNALVEFQVRLISRGRTCWQVDLPVARRPAVELLAGRAVKVAGRTFADGGDEATPPRQFEPVDYARRLAEAGPLIELSRVLPNAFYDACDQLGLGVLQRSPREPNPDVVKRLLRHPSILAFGDPLVPAQLWSGNRPASAGLR